LGELPFTGKIRVIPLPEDFVYRNCNGIGKIKTSQLVPHGDTEAFVGIVMQKCFRQPLILTTEDKVGIVRKRSVTVNGAAFCCKKEKISVRIFTEKITEIIVIGDVQLVPVVQSGTLEMLVGHLKTKRPYQMQPCARNSAGPGDIACILRYLRFNKNYVKVMHFYPLE